jgi:REP element-mobilizing transposase RayT
VSLLHAHLVFVTKYRRPVFTGQMLTLCEHTVGAVHAELDVELVEFNGEADHVQLLVAYPPTLAISTLVQRLKVARLTPCDANTWHLCPRPHARTPVIGAVFRRLPPRRTLVDQQAVHRRPSTPTISAGLRPATNGIGLTRT